MNEPLLVWAKLLLRLALVLLAIGLMPALAVQFVFPGIDALVPVLLLVSVAPLGAVCLVISAILFLAALVRRPPRGPS